MAVLQKLISSMLIANFVLGSVVCSCDANAAVDSTDTAQHAHHAIQSETANNTACPHTDCSGECASLTGIAADHSVLIPVPRTLELEDAVSLTVSSPTPNLFSDNHFQPVSVHSPPVAVADTPVSRFDQLLD